MANNTRERFLAVALDQFAERGFDGVSIAGIADVLGLSKQALLHHFESKEKLYGEVLDGISRAFQERIEATDATPKNDRDAIAALLAALVQDHRQHPQQTRLLMRELLDNSRRAERASHWYLRGFLDALVDRVHALPQWGSAGRHHAAAAVYQFLGAINYFAVSSPTLKAMFSDEFYADMDDCFDAQLEQLIRAGLAAGPASVRLEARQRNA
ncbi:MAG: TetR/AcrR family transcriptional regulator [Pseudomonadota bacterium]